MTTAISRTPSQEVVFDQYVGQLSNTIEQIGRSNFPFYEGLLLVFVKTEGAIEPTFTKKIIYSRSITELGQFNNTTYAPDCFAKMKNSFSYGLRDKIANELKADTQFSNSLFSTAGKIEVMWALCLSRGNHVGDLFTFFSGKLLQTGDRDITNNTCYTSVTANHLMYQEECLSAVGVGVREHFFKLKEEGKYLQFV